jgi:hypothetical protein
MTVLFDHFVIAHKSTCCQTTRSIPGLILPHSIIDRLRLVAVMATSDGSVRDRASVERRSERVCHPASPELWLGHIERKYASFFQMETFR